MYEYLFASAVMIIFISGVAVCGFLGSIGFKLYKILIFNVVFPVVLTPLVLCKFYFYDGMPLGYLQFFFSFVLLYGTALFASLNGWMGKKTYEHCERIRKSQGWFEAYKFEYFVFDCVSYLLGGALCCILLVMLWLLFVNTELLGFINV